MRSSGGPMVDILVAALVASAAVHVGVMMWAEPKVMTHVTSGIARIARRAPMTAKREEAPEEPVKLEIVQDLPAQKDAPEVDDSPVAVSAPDSLLPLPDDSMPTPTSVEAPEILDRLRPDADAPVIPVAPIAQADDMEKPVAAMPVEIVVPMAALDVGGVVAAGPAVETAVPAFEPPPPDPALGEPAADEVEKISSKDEKEKDGQPEFKPEDEVMPEVDEKVVEREKEAVRDLLDVESAADMATAVV